VRDIVSFRLPLPPSSLASAPPSSSRARRLGRGARRRVQDPEAAPADQGRLTKEETARIKHESADIAPRCYPDYEW
jgi:hypothetical protein